MSKQRSLGLVALLAVFALLAVACGGEAVRVRASGGNIAAAEGSAAEDPALSEGGSVSVGGEAAAAARRTTAAGGGDPKCATNSNPEDGFTTTTMKWGTIVPLTGALRPLGEQTARVMKTATETWLNSITKIPGPYDVEWGCSQRPGIFGRKVSLEVLSLQASTPEEAASHMRRLISQSKVFLVRDCYLQSNLMGPATQYQNQQGVPGVWCSHSEMPLPALAKWNFSPGVDPNKVTGVNVGALFRPPAELRAKGAVNRNRLAILADPTLEHTQVKAAVQIARRFGNEVNPDCIVLKKAQEAQTSMEAEITRIRTCYGGQSPDAVIAMDVFNGAFGALEAKDQNWPATSGQVQWACNTCWVTAIAKLCGDACTTMITDCQALPCIPWADRNRYPAAGVLKDVWQQYLSRDPEDVLTYGPAAITGGLGLWLGMTGPDLSRDKFRNTLENLKNWDAGIGPILTTGPNDHYGGKSVWLIRFTGTQGSPVPWFEDVTGRFVPLNEVEVFEEDTRTQ